MSNQFKTRHLPPIGLTIAVLLAGSGCRRAEPSAGDSAPEPVAQVRTAAVEEASLPIYLTAFGTVEAAPGESRTLSVPYECRIARVFVVSGQEVEPNDPLVEVEPSPGTRLQMNLARQERDTDRQLADLTRQRLVMKLATQQELTQSEQALAAAESKLQSLEQAGADGSHTLVADQAGIVCALNTETGRIEPSGAALLKTVSRSQILVRLGVESEDLNRLQEEQPVKIEPVNEPGKSVPAVLSRITHELNPDTRLINVYVRPNPGARLFLNEYVRGRIVLDTPHGLVVPQESVLPEGDKSVIYTVEKKHAVKHDVQTGSENAGRVLIVSPEIHPGQTVVVTGNSELTDGMAVDVEPQP